jgi:hypothetical protein
VSSLQSGKSIKLATVNVSAQAANLVDDYAFSVVRHRSGRVTAQQEVRLKRSMIGLWRGGHRSMKQKSRSPKQRKHPKTRLRLPDLEFSKSAMLNRLTSVDGQRGYGHAIDEFVDWYRSEPRLALNRTVVLRYRSYLEARLLAPGTVNLRLGAVRHLAYGGSRLRSAEHRSRRWDSSRQGGQESGRALGQLADC